jgi:hypothetical protein
VEMIFSVVIVISLFWCIAQLVRYAYQNIHNPICATMVDCCNDMLAQITQEPDVIWLTSVVQHQDKHKTATIALETKHRQR